ncbi:MAG: TonB-dependent receptor [Phocaeicola sp.]
MKKELLIAVVSALPLLGLQAQQDSTLVRTLVVEHEYNPTILDATKINILPKVEEPIASKAGVEYATAFRPLTHTNYEAMRPLTPPWKDKKGERGYLKAAYGNYANVNVGAGYLWDITKADRLEAEISVTGMNEKLPSPTDVEWKSRFYDSGIKLGYEHRFSMLSLHVGGGFQSQVFNYMPLPTQNSSQSFSDKQHHTLANFLVGVQSHSSELPLQFAAEMGYNHFDKKYAPFPTDKISEKEFYFKGNAWGIINDEQRVGVAAQFNNYSYGASQQEDFFSVQLNPYYTLANEAWKLRLAAHVDWQNRNESGFKIAPDIKVDYIFADSYVLYLNAEGGRVHNDFRRLNSISPYWNTNLSISSSYVPLNAYLGFKASPINNLWFNVFGGYRICDQDLSGVLYQNRLMSVHFLQAQTQAAYGGAELKYGYKERVEAGLKGTFYSWKAKGANSDLFLASKPKFELNAEVTVQIIKPLEVKVSYDYMKRPSTSSSVLTEVANPLSSGAPTAGTYSLGDVNNLNLAITYKVWKGIALFGEVQNILNKTYYLEGGYPAQGVNLLGGFSFHF